MSRVANNPVTLPKGVEVTVRRPRRAVKGAKGSAVAGALCDGVQVKTGRRYVTFAYDSDGAKAMAGTTRALVNNMVKGVSEGWEREAGTERCRLPGQGEWQQRQPDYRPFASGRLRAARGSQAETPTQTEIVIKGIDKQAVGEAAAKIRSFRPPEPYKGKGIRYADEYVRRKEAKKK
jgi:large subunit ribosomal protein L6